LQVGWKREWGGWFYALDFYNPAVQAHLAGVFHMVTEKWGFGLLKLDFLFSVCVAPPPGKTRGQVMYEAMELVRQLAGRSRIWAGGVPLGSAFGQTDHCEVGGTPNSGWESALPAFLGYRERSGVLASLRSALHRWPLNGRAFLNVSGPFTLLDNKRGLNPMQQQTVLAINVLLGNSLFTSDDVGRWSAEQLAEYSEALVLRDSRVESVAEVLNDLYRIDFEHHGERYAAWCNLNGKSVQIPQMELRSYETIVLSA
jgi:alpha-galactosidase